MFDDVKLKVYDLGGNGQFRNVWQRFYAEIWGFIFVVDASDPDRFDESKTVLEEMISHKMVTGKPFIVVANKQDKQGAIAAAGLKIRFQMGRRVPFYDAIATKVEDDKCHEGVSGSVSSLVTQILAEYQKLARRREADLEEQRQIDEAEQEEKRARLQKRREELAAKSDEEPPAEAVKQEELETHSGREEEGESNVVVV
jgi:ADP-ribosylation factor-like protein 13B